MHTHLLGELGYSRQLTDQEAIRLLNTCQSNAAT